MKVLWLPSWFPNRTAPYNGDFIERHAAAVAPFIDQLIILAVVKDDAMPKGSTEIIRRQHGNICIFTACYGGSRLGIAEKLFSFRTYFSLQKKLYRQVLAEFGEPALVHVHVPMKAGLFALYLQKKYSIPYIVTEHWAGYSRLAKPGIRQYGTIFNWFNNRVLKAARIVLTVSDDLGNTIAADFVNIPYTVVPNVVDTSLFFPVHQQANSTLQLIHASTMGYQKNMPAMMAALALWKKNGAVFRLDCYGPADDSVRILVQQSGLEREVHFRGEVPQPALAKAMQSSDALILYSRYETFGCVIIEANACGIPVIVSDLAVFHELVEDEVNGVFARPDDPAALAAALQHFSASRSRFDKKRIAAAAFEKYNYNVVGQQLLAVYRQVLAEKITSPGTVE